MGGGHLRDVIDARRRPCTAADVAHGRRLRGVLPVASLDVAAQLDGIPRVQRLLPDGARRRHRLWGAVRVRARLRGDAPAARAGVARFPRALRRGDARRCRGHVCRRTAPEPPAVLAGRMPEKCGAVCKCGICGPDAFRVVAPFMLRFPCCFVSAEIRVDGSLVAYAPRCQVGHLRGAPGAVHGCALPVRPTPARPGRLPRASRRPRHHEPPVLPAVHPRAVRRHPDVFGRPGVRYHLWFPEQPADAVRLRRDSRRGRHGPGGVRASRQVGRPLHRRVRARAGRPAARAGVAVGSPRGGLGGEHAAQCRKRRLQPRGGVHGGATSTPRCQ